MKTMLKMIRPISGALTTTALLAAALLAVANASVQTPHRRMSCEAIGKATTSAPHGDGYSSRAADTRSAPSCAYINDELIRTRKTIEETAAAMKISVERVRTCRNDAELEGSPAFPARHTPLSADEREIVHAFCNGVDIDAPDGPQCVIGDLCDQAITISSVYRGAFSAPGKTEALVDFDDPCKALVEGLGGYALLRLEPGGWSRILTANDRLEQCISFRGTGGARDFLACAHLELCSSGCGRSWWLSTVHVRGDSIVPSGALFSLDDNTPALDGACWTGESGDIVWSWFTSPDVRITSRGGGIAVACSCASPWGKHRYADCWIRCLMATSRPGRHRTLDRCPRRNAAHCGTSKDGSAERARTCRTRS